MNPLRNAREFCFQFFFHLQLPVFQSLRQELAANDKTDSLNHSIEEFRNSTNVLFNDSAHRFIFQQLLSALQNYDAIERIIEANLKNWRLARLSKVDHTNLLLAVNDLCFQKSAPKKVIINEAIEISKKFGTEESASFINGVLDSVIKSKEAS